MVGDIVVTWRVVVHVTVRKVPVTDVYIRLVFGNAEVEGQLSNML